MSRYNNSVFNHSFEGTSGSIDTNFVENGVSYNVYKFRIVSGIERLTNFGEQKLNVSPNKLNQTINVYTGQSPVVVVWDGSVKSYEKYGKPFKEMNIGKYYKCYGSSSFETNSTNEEIEIFGTSYKTQFIDKTINLTSDSWIPTDSDMSDYFYLIIDKRAKIYQWLELTSFSPSYNEFTQKLDKSLLSFSSINIKYASSGKQILNFIQFGSPGEGYPFPKETINEKNEIIVSLDEDLLNDNNLVKNIQIDFMNASGDSSFAFYGRRRTNHITGEMDVPKRLFIYEVNYPKESFFFYNSPNLNNYHSINMKPSKISMWNDYRNSYNGNNNIGSANMMNTKEVRTGLKPTNSTVAELRNSNPDLKNSNWDNKPVIDFKDVELDFKQVPYVKNTTLNKKVNFATFFNINSFINFYVESFNYEYNELTKWKISDVVGILGGIFSVLVGGLNINFTTNTSLSPSTQPLNLTFPALSILDTIGYGETETSNSVVPIDLFDDDKSTTFIPFFTKIRTSWNFSLTDLVQDTSNIDYDEDAIEGKGKNGVWNTIYLGQDKDFDGKPITPDMKTLELDLNKTEFLNSTEEGFIIDYIEVKSIASCDVRITTYNMFGDMNYSSIFETNSKSIGDIRQWKTTIKFNYYDEFNTEGKIEWPVITKAPVGIEIPDKPLEEFNSKTIYNGESISTSQWTSYETNMLPGNTSNQYEYTCETFLEIDGVNITNFQQIADKKIEIIKPYSFEDLAGSSTELQNENLENYSGFIFTISENQSRVVNFEQEGEWIDFDLSDNWEETDYGTFIVGNGEGANLSLPGGIYRKINATYRISLKFNIDKATKKLDIYFKYDRTSKKNAKINLSFGSGSGNSQYNTFYDGIVRYSFTELFPKIGHTTLKIELKGKKYDQ